MSQASPIRLPTRGYAALAAGQPLVPWAFTRRPPRPHDVLVEIEYCGVCHSDLHFVNNDLGISQFPLVPGHEIVGKVHAVGSAAHKFKVGDTVGIGVLVDSCRSCASCEADLEQFCLNQATYTYSLPDRQGDGLTYGGYSNQITCHEDFVFSVAKTLPAAKVAPLLCAGITTYSPLKQWKIGPGAKVAVVGLGGLGHMGVKLAAAFGARVSVLSRTPAKEDDARRLGAEAFVNTTNEAAAKACQGTFDFILDTVSTDHDYAAYLGMLRPRGTMVCVGLVTAPAQVPPPSLIFGGRTFSGSLIGGRKETQEMLDFCRDKEITADVEVIKMNEINTAYERMKRSDVKYRFVIDMKSL